MAKSGTGSHFEENIQIEMTRQEGLNYAPQGERKAVVEEGEFVFSVAHLDHGHIYGQTNGLLEAGATLKHVFDPDPAKVKAFLGQYPEAERVDSLDRILDDSSVHLVAVAAVPNDRCAIGLRVMAAGKDFFTDKAPFTALDQLASARQAVEDTNRKYMVYYSERLHVEASIHAGKLIDQGVVGKVLQVINLAPHRLSRDLRPDWFWSKKKTGGILVDIGSHQFEQFLAYTGAKDAVVEFARTENYSCPDHPEFEDFGEASLRGNDGSSFYTRVDWFTPDGSRAWGDGRTFVMGTKGVIEIRKYMDVGRSDTGDRIFLVDGSRETEIECSGQIGFPFFGDLILDVLNRTEKSMTQEHAFKAAELSLIAQEMADAKRR